MAYFRVNLLRLNNYHRILNLNVALSRNLGIWKMFHDWFLSCTWKRMEPRSIIEHNFFVYRVSVRTSMKKKSVLRASPNLTSNCFLGRKNFSQHYHCLYRHHFKTGEGRGVRERSSLARHWYFDKRISSILNGAKRLPEIMYFLSIFIFLLRDQAHVHPRCAQNNSLTAG